MHASSPYLRQHAHNPVFWYPWGKEAFDRALSENKPILLSIGYSTCYWCHVMEREVFENLSIASLMNANFINIKVDREEYPELDEIYMVARQLMTHEGGWPNNVFLTPDLKPFYAGGTYGPDETYGKPGFPRLLEWLNYSWTTQEATVRQTADNITETMQPFLTFQAGPDRPVKIGKEAEGLYEKLKSHHDERSGGFFQAPKFPHENYLQFLIGYFEYSGDKKALDIVTHSLSKMAAGGFYDHVGCGFHRYAVDKEWYVPHFEKMLYTQALLARNYTDAARLSGNPYFADIAKSILDFVSGPLTDGNGAFYSALDAETDSVEGAYYAWTSEEIQASLTPEEAHFFVNFYALADIPAFPGHKHVNGQVIVARKPLDQAAHERNMPYVQLAALAAQVMNKLLIGRNARPTPRLDDKIIVAWNGMMIDAFAHAAKVFSEPHYAQMARKAVDFLLEHAIDNEGRLSRIIAAGRAHKAGTLEDYAWLIRGLLTLYRATPEDTLLESAVSLMEQADDLFYDSAGGYFFTQASEQVLIRIKNAQDSALPSANAIMLQNLVDLFEFTKDVAYRERAQAQSDYFIKGNIHAQPDSAGMFQAALRLDGITGGKVPEGSATFDSSLAVGAVPEAPDGVAEITATLFPADAKPGENCELIITIDLGEGWHINAGRVNQPYLIPTQVDVQGRDIRLVGMVYPEPLRKTENGEELLVYEGQVNITARIRLADKGKERPKLKAMVRLQPCRGTICHAVRDTTITI